MKKIIENSRENWAENELLIFKGSDHCMTCGENINEFETHECKHLVKELNGKISQIKDEKEKLENNFSNLEKEISSLKKELEDLKNRDINRMFSKAMEKLSQVEKIAREACEKMKLYGSEDNWSLPYERQGIIGYQVKVELTVMVADVPVNSSQETTLRSF